MALLRRSYFCLILIVAGAFPAPGLAQSPSNFEAAMALYHEGDLVGARAALETLAQAGEVKAQFNLGVMMREGKGGEKNLTGAFGWFLKAAEQGNPTSAGVVGSMYDWGIGVAEDNVQAARWYHIAADKDDAAAQYNLGQLYMAGEGVAKDASAAVNWWRKSANLGFAEAQYDIAIAYGKGTGVDENQAQYHYWMRRAAAQGYEHAIPAAARLRGAAYPDELAEVEKLIAAQGTIPKAEAERVETAKLEASRAAAAEAAAAEAFRKFTAESAEPAPPTPSAPSKIDEANALIGMINGEQQNYSTNVTYAKNWYDRGETVEACRYYQKQLYNVAALKADYAKLGDVLGTAEYRDEVAQYEEEQRIIYDNESDDCRDAGVILSY